MGISYNPSIVTEGLVLGLDPQSTRSYVGSGTTWTDLTNRGNSGTLTNGPVFIPGGPFNNSGGSVLFDGDVDYLTLASSNDFNFDGDFTIEAWIYFSSFTTYLPIIETRSSASSTPYAFGVFDSSGYRLDFLYASSARITSSSLVTPNKWTHVSVTRSSSTIRLFIDGVLDANLNSYSPAINASSSLRIGSIVDPIYFSGHISNLRILKGTALYTSNFTPPTGPLEAIDDTVLLTCQGGAITDNGPSSHAITVNNDAKAITASAFEFDGTNDCVDVTNNANLYPGTGDFTAEVWCLGESATSDYHYLLSNYGNSGSNYYGWAILTQSNGSGIRVFMASGSGATSVGISNTTVNLNDSNWHHVVFVRSGNAIRLYHNGEQLESDGDVTGYNVTSSEAKFRIGKLRDAADPNGGYNFWNGKISGVKIYKGKGLTEDEVKRNFSALRGRYGI